MRQSTTGRAARFAQIATIIVALGLLGYAIRKPDATSRQGNEAKAVASNVVVAEYQPSATNAPQQVLKLHPDDLLATINGRALKARDVLPPGTSNQLVSIEACEYFLQRAIDRELILQTAQAQGVELDQSQEQQILDFKTARGQSGPGLVRKLNGGSEEQSFELRDAEAFMLQTSLLEKSGALPNVTEDQVSAYYQQHASDLGGLPTDEPARSDAWKSIDVEIREKLAPQVRSDFQNRLADYMKQLKAKAEIRLTSLTSFTSEQ